jgi:O-antigen/teichoic acid export membrane protein
MISKAINRVKALVRRAQVTRATFYGIISVGLRFITAPVTVIVIMANFTSDLQGYYYTFTSVLALSVFVELGFSKIITYFAAHEWAKLSFDPNGRIIGDADALSRLVSLGQATCRWYLVGGIVVIFGIGAAGYVFFLKSPNVGIAWASPWFALCLVSGINFALMPVWSLLEGCNQVAQIYLFRMVGVALTVLSVWAAIYLGAGLWTGSISITVLLIWSAIFCWRYRRFIEPFLRRPTGPRVSWWGEIWQVQWRTALSYMSGYFTAQAFTPILFYFHGPIVAGQFGMTFSVICAVGTFSAMWSAPRGPEFAMMIARKEYKAMDQLLYRILKVALVVSLLAGLCIWSLIYVLNMMNHPFTVRLLPPGTVAILLLGIIVANVLTPASVYLRAHKREPFVVISLAYGVLVGLFSLVLGIRFSSVGIAVAYLGSNLIFFPVRLWIFYYCRREWHRV